MQQDNIWLVARYRADIFTLIDTGQIFLHLLILTDPTPLVHLKNIGNNTFTKKLYIPNFLRNPGLNFRQKVFKKFSNVGVLFYYRSGFPESYFHKLYELRKFGQNEDILILTLLL